MSKLPPPYRKLSPRTGSWLISTRLWLAHDHLLEVTSIAGYEKYRRFYFRDLEAVIFRRTSHRAVWNALLAAATVLALGLAGFLFSQSDSGLNRQVFGGATLVAFCAGLGIAAILWNSWRGQTCACFVQTRTGSTTLKSLRRLRAARRVRDRLTAVVAAAQETPPPLPGEAAR